MIELGEMVKDSITGFEGIVVGITDFLFGCRQVGVQSTVLKDGRPLEPEWFDEQRLTTSRNDA